MTKCEARDYHGIWTRARGSKIAACRDCGKTNQQVSEHEGSHKRAMSVRGPGLPEGRLNDYLAIAALKG